MISKQITQYRYDALTKEQAKLNEDLEFYLDEQRKARDKGDLSENEEYSTASQNVQQSRQRLIQIADELADVEILEVDMGPRIGLGCKVEIVETDENHNPLTQAQALTTIIRQIRQIASKILRRKRTVTLAR